MRPRSWPAYSASAYLTLVLGLLLCVRMADSQSVQAAPAGAPAIPTARFEKYYRTELYFGRSIPGGGLVSDQDWSGFLAETVTPRFPEGFTTLKAIGQYREKSGRIVTEPSEVLIFFYTGRSKDESRAKIEAIRAAYIKRFKQESVLRVDLPKTVRVSF